MLFPRLEKKMRGIFSKVALNDEILFKKSVILSFLTISLDIVQDQSLALGHREAENFETDMIQRILAMM